MFPLQETHGAVVIHAARYLLKLSTRATDYILPVAPQPSRFFLPGIFTHPFARFQPFHIKGLRAVDKRSKGFPFERYGRERGNRRREAAESLVK